MYVVVHHRIKDPKTAFARGERLIASEDAPQGVRVLQFYPSQDGSAVTCLWEAESVSSVQEYVDTTLGDSSENTSYAVDTSHAFAEHPSQVAPAPAAISS